MNSHPPVHPSAALLARLQSQWSGGDPSLSKLLNQPSLLGETIEDFTPIPLNLEWRLAALAWAEMGPQWFTDGDVPFAANCSGPPSEHAAALLYASCEAAPPAGEILVLEIGSGSGLFARYLLDAFQSLCAGTHCDFYDRLRFFVTDASARTVSHWDEIGLFAPHAGRVICTACDAREAARIPDGPLRAVFANYILDSLPVRFLRRTDHGWEDLHARASLRRGNTLAEYTELTLEEIRAAAAAEPVKLISLLPLLDCEMAFRPLDPETEGPSKSFIRVAPESTWENSLPDCYGAVAVLDAILAALEPQGFVSIRDYGFTAEQTAPRTRGGDRFGPATAAGLNLSQLDGWAGANGLAAYGSEITSSITHSRLYARNSHPDLGRVFYEGLARESAGGPWAAHHALEQARCGQTEASLAEFRAMLETHGNDWSVLAITAELLLTVLHNPEAALEIALAALRLNPWYAPRTWNTAGDCLIALGRYREGQECYTLSLALSPSIASTHLKMAEAWLRLNQPQRCLEAVAQGLAYDRGAMLRKELLDAQSAAIARLSIRWTHERETAHRRSQQAEN